MTAAPLLEAADVDYSYPVGPPTIRRLSLSIGHGKRLALLGGNGAGKSTLLMLLNASLEPSRGEILLDGVPVGYGRKARNAHRRRVGLVLQDPDDQLFSASVYEDVSFGPLNLGLGEAEARARVERVLADLGLTSFADRPAHLLSYGQRKRVAIAGVAAMQPEVMLLDEPLSGLDPTARLEVLETLERLEVAGTTVVITTHDVDLALAWADEAAVMSDGAVVAADRVGTILGDRSLMEAARLVRPAVIDLAEALRRRHAIGESDRPRSAEELLAMLVAAERADEES